LKPQKRSCVGSDSTRRHSSTKLRPTIRRVSGWRCPTDAPGASRDPTTTSACSTSSSIRSSDSNEATQSASQWSRSGCSAASIPRLIE
jgi:hypothetical protein